MRHRRRGGVPWLTRLHLRGPRRRRKSNFCDGVEGAPLTRRVGQRARAPRVKSGQPRDGPRLSVHGGAHPVVRRHLAPCASEGWRPDSLAQGVSARMAHFHGVPARAPWSLTSMNALGGPSGRGTLLAGRGRTPDPSGQSCFLRDPPGIRFPGESRAPRVEFPCPTDKPR